VKSQFQKRTRKGRGGNKEKATGLSIGQNLKKNRKRGNWLRGRKSLEEKLARYFLRGGGGKMEFTGRSENWNQKQGKRANMPGKKGLGTLGNER